MIKYIILFAILTVILLLYIRISIKYEIIDNPNLRSSHDKPTIRGAGIIFWFTGLFFFLLYFPEYILFFSGLTIVAVVSFVDDLLTLGRWSRFFSHLAGITLIFLALDLFNILPWYIVVVGYILLIGVLNAYNFMDGINGMTGLYSLSVLGILQWINLKIVPFTEPDFIWYPIIACLVFLLFNFRKRALCFAGDIGSIAVAFWIITLLLIVMVKTGTIVWLLLLAVYGIDSVFTIIHRIWLRQNIFKAHRMHFYQVLANEGRIDHRIISAGYALLQMVISVGVIAGHGRMNLFLLSTIILIPLGFVYLLKFRVKDLGWREGKGRVNS